MNRLLVVHDMVCVCLCAVNILLIPRFISVAPSLSVISVVSQSLLHSLARSVIETKRTKKNLWWQKNRCTSSNKKLFCGHFTHFLLIHTSVLVLGEVFLGVFKGNPVLVWWNIHRDTGNTQTNRWAKTIIMQKQRPKENKRLWMCYHESTVL